MQTQSNGGIGLWVLLVVRVHAQTPAPIGCPEASWANTSWVALWITSPPNISRQHWALEVSRWKPREPGHNALDLEMDGILLTHFSRPGHTAELTPTPGSPTQIRPLPVLFHAAVSHPPTASPWNSAKLPDARQATLQGLENIVGVCNFGAAELLRLPIQRHWMWQFASSVRRQDRRVSNESAGCIMRRALRIGKECFTGSDRKVHKVSCPLDWVTQHHHAEAGSMQWLAGVATANVGDWLGTAQIPSIPSVSALPVRFADRPTHCYLEPTTLLPLLCCVLSAGHLESRKQQGSL
ncbi:hypothetical protein MAPG_02213 [Magnaporthiopsis poae ATCC 64411]|uniref:Uncharacterized protein n=1 Tax=Magnaporthiopsis poae (strain ATCC 64411 / 73-15) TaxID=644358 RepID=A0A0C4DQR7_MAGP6|nr:hypothetical protein MAPG_02213 [Magnaporthiopsis poae ATCC 64411]